MREDQYISDFQVLAEVIYHAKRKSPPNFNPGPSTYNNYHPLHSSTAFLLHSPQPPKTMFKPTQTYNELATADSLAELDDWHDEPVESVESRSHQVNLHRRPGFLKKGLLVSVAVNAVLLMVCGWLYLRLRV